MCDFLKQCIKVKVNKVVIKVYKVV